MALIGGFVLLVVKGEREESGSVERLLVLRGQNLSRHTYLTGANVAVLCSRTQLRWDLSPVQFGPQCEMIKE